MALSNTLTSLETQTQRARHLGQSSTSSVEEALDMKNYLWRFDRAIRISVDADMTDMRFLLVERHTVRMTGLRG